MEKVIEIGKEVCAWPGVPGWYLIRSIDVEASAANDWREDEIVWCDGDTGLRWIDSEEGWKEALLPSGGGLEMTETVVNYCGSERKPSFTDYLDQWLCEYGLEYLKERQ